LWVVAALSVFAVSCRETPRSSRRELFQPLYRAARAVDGAIAAGVSYADLGSLVRQLSTELLIAGDSATSDDDKKLVAAYGELLATYKDSLTVWKHQIDSGKYEWLHGQIPVDPEVAPLVQKYNLPTTDAGTSAEPFRVASASSLQVVWGAASVKSREAVSLYLSADSPANK